jgi:Uncharacterised nucleotidyltransferase
VTAQRYAGSFWPTAKQERLLQALLLDGDDGLRAWVQLEPGFEINDLEAGSYNLMPLLACHADRLQISPALRRRLTGIYRRSWYMNQIQLDRLVSLVAALREGGLDPIVVNGPVFAMRQYQDLGARATTASELLIRPTQLELAVQRAKAAGWRSDRDASDTATRRGCRVRLTGRDGDTVSLHTELFHEFVGSGIQPLDLWKASQMANVDGSPLRVLEASDELLNICLSGARPGSSRNLRWIVDVVVLIRRASTHVDWGRLLTQADRLRATLRLRDALSYTALVVAAPVPAWVLDELATLHVPRREQLAHRAGAVRGAVVGPAPESLVRFLRVTADEPLLRALNQLPSYLRDEWGIARTADVAPAALRKAAARFASAARHAARPTTRAAVGARSSSARRG